MTHMTVDVLAISGPGGVGKSSVAFEASLILQRAGIAHALIDTDELDRVFPIPDDHAAFAEGNLTALWRRFAEKGVERLILVGVVLDRPSEVAGVHRAIPGSSFTLVRLTASPEVLAERVTRREIGSGAEAQLERTLRRSVEFDPNDDANVQAIVTDGRSVEAIATAVLARTGWLG